jgi:hypothetical protein
MKTRYNHTFRAFEDARVPQGAGDRYWSQDLLRDMQYLRDRSGLDEIGLGSILYSGPFTQGSDKLHINVGACAAIIEIYIEVPDDSGGWKVPLPTRTDKIKVICRSIPVFNIAIPENSLGSIYLKWREINGATRERQRGTGTYPYYLEDYFEITPVLSDGCVKIAGYDNSGGILIITPEKTIAESLSNLVKKAPYDDRMYGMRNDIWSVINIGDSGTTGDAIEALKLYSKKSLMVTNSRIIERRQRGYDIGLQYLSLLSEVYHFDTDLLNQNQQSNIMIGYSGEAPVLVGKDDFTGIIYFNPAVQEVAPYEMKGRSLYGRFSITAQITGDNTTAEFWARLFQDQNIVILRLSSATDEIVFSIGGSDPEYSEPDDDDIPYSIPDPDDIPYSAAGINGVKVEYSEPDDDNIPYSEPDDDNIPYSVASTNGGNRVEHIWKGGSESISLDDEGVEIEEGVWIHIAVVTTIETISLFINDKKIEFQKNSQATQTMTLEINEDEDKFNIDELTLDQTVTCGIEAFSENTHNRIPYAALDYQKKWLVIEAQDTNYVKTNLFETEEFKAAVRAVINS